MPENDPPKIDEVIASFKLLQEQCCTSFETVEENSNFLRDTWEHENGGGGQTNVLENGYIFEKAGVNFSHVKGDRLPESASMIRKNLSDKPFEATGVSIVVHPNNPYVPTAHMNVRFFISDPNSDAPVWWFGGGYDLTPYYGFEEDCRHWHYTARSVCDKYSSGSYDLFKARCDQYFFLKHRNEPRGIGGIFFDDLNEKGFNNTFDFIKGVGTSFLEGYVPIVKKRSKIAFGQREKDFQRYRRGRYVEFNLIHDRGTLFGLQSGGRTESILMSLPPSVEWKYNWVCAPDTDEARLYTDFLKPKDWLSS